MSSQRHPDLAGGGQVLAPLRCRRGWQGAGGPWQRPQEPPGSPALQRLHLEEVWGIPASGDGAPRSSPKWPPGKISEENLLMHSHCDRLPGSQRHRESRRTGAPNRPPPGRAPHSKRSVIPSPAEGPRSGQLTKPHCAALIKRAGCSLPPWVYIHILTASIETDLPE